MKKCGHEDYRLCTANFCHKAYKKEYQKTDKWKAYMKEYMRAYGKKLRDDAKKWRQLQSRKAELMK